MAKNSDKKIFIWQGGWRGGAEEVTLTLAEFLRTRYGITATLGVYRGERRNDMPYPQIEVPRLLPKWLVAYNNWIAPLFLRRELDAYDLILSHSLGWYGRHLHKFVYREPGDLRHLLRSLSWRSRLLYAPVYWWTCRLIPRAGTIVSASRRSDQFFTRLGREDYIQTSNFIDGIEPRTEALSCNKELRIIFIGRDDQIKRLSLLRRAVESLDIPIVLHVFGTAGTSTDRIRYHGWVDKKEVINFLRDQAHVFVLPSEFEASPLSLLEALAAGVPSTVAEPACPLELQKFVGLFTTQAELEAALRECWDHYDEYAKVALQTGLYIGKEYDTDRVLDREFEALFEYVANS